MKKLIRLFLLLFYISAFADEGQYVENLSKFGCPSDSLILVSFNGMDFGKTKTPAQLSFLAKLFSKADIIQLQEVVAKNGGTDAVSRFADALNRTGASWDYFTSNPTLGNEQERFSALWKKSSVKFLKKESGLLDGFAIVRNPFVSFFEYDGKSFGVYSFHLAPTRKNPIREAQEIANNNGNIITTKTAFLVGDFNLSGSQLSPYFEKKLGFKKHIFSKTSLKKDVSRTGEYVFKEYDNIFSKGDFRICKSGVIDFVPYFQDLSEARKLSDHLPVFVVFYGKKEKTLMPCLLLLARLFY